MTKPWRFTAASGPPPFDPATLALTAWWRSYANASPWVGTASAGTSASQDATGFPGTKPGAGPTLNGYTTADFNGSSQYLVPDDTLATYYDADGYGGWALIYLDGVVTDDATANGAIENEALFAADTGYHAIYFRANGGSPLIGISHYASGATYDNATASISTGAWVLVHWRFTTGTNALEIGTNGTWAAPVTAAGDLNATALGLTLNIGRNYAHTKYFDGKLEGFGLFDFSPSDSDINNIKSYANARYGLSL